MAMTFQEEIDKLIKSNELYFIGSRLPADWYEGFANWLPLADAGDAKAQFNVGYCYEHGEGTHHDLEKAYDYYTKASNQSDLGARYNLGMMYLHGVHVKKSKDQALELFTQAMELGEVRAPRWVLDEKARNAYKAGNTGEAKKHLIEMLRLAKVNFRLDDQRVAEAGIVALAFSESELAIYKTETHTWEDGRPTFVNIEVKENVPADIRKVGYNAQLDNEKLYWRIAKDNAYTLVREWELDRESYVLTFERVTITYALTNYYELDFNKPISITIPPAKKSGCFILTACFESYDAPTVFAFRQYRDNHLSRTSFGRGFIEWYYTYGPTMAEFISDKPRTKAILKFIFNQLAKVLPR
jgi:hypothetical protein